jgi:hypothetical protein
MHRDYKTANLEMISVIKKEMPYICTKRVGKMFVFLIVILCLSVE